MANQYIAIVGSSTGQPAFTDLSGNIAISQMNGGTGASGSTFWRGDGTWSTVGTGSANWDALGNAANNLILSNGNFTTEFDQTSAVNWTWKNTTAATSLASQSSPIINIVGEYWNGTASAADTWSIQDVVANGTNAACQLKFSHSGTTGSATIDLSSFAPALGGGPTVLLGVNGTGIGGSTTASQIGLYPQNTASSNLDLRIYNRQGSSYVQNVLISSGQLSGGPIGPASGAALLIETLQNTSTTQCVVLAGSGGTGTGPAVLIGGNAGGNSKTFQATTGTQYGVMLGGADAAAGVSGFSLLFNPASGTAKFVALDLCPEINQTSTASGSYTALQVNSKETAVLGTGNLLLDLQITSVSKFAVNSVGKVSQYNGVATVSNGVPTELATVDLTAQAAAIAATTLYAVPATGGGMYRISAYAKVTTAATTSSTLGGATGLVLGFTDNTDSVVQSVTAQLGTQGGTSAINNAGNTTTSVLQGEIVVWAKASTSITYAFGYTSSGATAMQYELHLKVEAL